MVKLEKPEAFGRSIRKDDLNQLGISTWTMIKEAIKDGKTQEALDLVDYQNIEGKRNTHLTSPGLGLLHQVFQV